MINFTNFQIAVPPWDLPFQSIDQVVIERLLASPVDSLSKIFLALLTLRKANVQLQVACMSQPNRRRLEVQDSNVGFLNLVSYSDFEVSV